VRKTLKIKNLPSNLPPRGLNGRQAAEYFGVSLGTLKKLVGPGLVSPPIKLPGCKREIYDRLRIDADMTARSKASPLAATPEPERASG
jgi:hypothetical protein